MPTALRLKFLELQLELLAAMLKAAAAAAALVVACSGAVGLHLSHASS